MTLTLELYKQVKDDLKKDFPDIKDIKKEEDTVIITGNDDILWDIFEILFNGVENIEFNAEKDKEHYLTIKF